ncbi:glycine/sarcosine/betaine reductase selenoprotein B family protein [Kroppenstedtia guangzhouensis]|uniref:glycine/sarcosine/betaine reductase selenoprotein B family protein n=1 Tax=Kroppenstedtia guangzhouensis TaxID=1274356 RepID=UPI00166762AB|nr:glycine/sarcosine/betaine reductase selenoprotein B family protein [Kroppenstedtia guangzhouensis]
MNDIPSSSKVAFGKRMMGKMARSRWVNGLMEKSPRFSRFYDRLHVKMSREWSGDIPWTPLNKPVSESRVALVSTGGVILKSHTPFDLNDAAGDCSYRIIPANSTPEEIVISHLFYDHSDAKMDLEVMFPLATLHRLQQEETIGSVAPRHVSFQGGISDPKRLVNETAPEAAGILVNDQVDLAILTPG